MVATSLQFVKKNASSVKHIKLGMPGKSSIGFSPAQQESTNSTHQHHIKGKHGGGTGTEGSGIRVCDQEEMGPDQEKLA